MAAARLQLALLKTIASQGAIGVTARYERAQSDVDAIAAHAYGVDVGVSVDLSDHWDAALSIKNAFGRAQFDGADDEDRPAQLTLGVATARRQGAASITQIDINLIRPQRRSPENPWPQAPLTYEPTYAEAEETVVSAVAPAPVASSSVASGSPISADSLSPEMIDAIARRAVEQLSEKVVQEIAWEVVPQLAELLIKRQLEEKNS